MAELSLRQHSQLSPTNYFIGKQTFEYLAAQVKEGITQKLIHFTNILGYLPMHYNQTAFLKAAAPIHAVING